MLDLRFRLTLSGNIDALGEFMSLLVILDFKVPAYVEPKTMIIYVAM